MSQIKQKIIHAFKEVYEMKSNDKRKRKERETMNGTNKLRRNI